MIRVRHWAAAAVVGSAALGLTACNNSATPDSAAGAAASASAPADIGASLYPAAPMPQLPPPAARGQLITLQGVVQSDVRVQVPAQVDGVIDLIAVPLEKGQPFDPNDPEIVFHPRDPKMAYRRLRENDAVHKDQQLARLDEQLVQLTIRQNEALIKACKDAIKFARESEEAQQKSYDLYKDVKGAVSESEKLNMISQLARYRENRVTAEKDLAKFQGELDTAEAQLRRHFIQSRINGRVVKLLKSPGEFAKAGEPILEIQATDRVRVEGKLDAQYASQVRRGMKVVVEPARPVGPNPLYNPGHRQEVTAIAVTAHPGRPMIVSGGQDGTALVWDVFGTKQSYRLPHPAGVRAVAATGARAKQNLVATGGEDGKVRVWNLSNPDKIPTEPLITFEDAHAGAVTAAAFSPDGRFLATASGRDVFVWSVSERKKLYDLPPEHRDAVMAIRFTPQATLVTAARDRTVRVWKLGDRGASPRSVIDHRGGAVDVLGVSHDGAKVLFDKDPGRLDVVSLADERSVGTLQDSGGAARFATLALFSPDDRLVLTAGGEADQRGELTVWEAPQSGGRGAELRRLMAPRGSAVTCAAFSPDATKRVIAAGTADGGVYFWTTPSEREKSIVGEVVSIVSADARSMQIRVEMPNPTDQWGEGLKERSLATIIIDPNQKVAPPPAAPAPAAPQPAGVRPIGAVGNPQGGLVVPAVAVAPAAIPPVSRPKTVEK
jgi:WD40 repeat protein